MVKKYKAGPPVCPNSIDTLEELDELDHHIIVEEIHITEHLCYSTAYGVESGNTVVLQAHTHDLGPGRTLLKQNGRWRDTMYLLINRNPRVANEVYFQDLCWCYENRQEFGHPDFYGRA